MAVPKLMDPEMTGGGSAEVPAPSPAPTEVVETPAPAAETPQGVQTPSDSLYDLPDGRKLTAEQVKEEYLSLQKDYTQKSQRLAAIEKTVSPPEIKNDVPEWKRPDYAPKSWAEVVELSKAQAIEELRAQAAAEEKRTREVASLVDQQIAEIKKTDKDLNENALFAHATKYGFRDLKQAHENLRAIKQAELAAEQRTLKNLKSRGEVPVAGAAGSGVPDGQVGYGEYRNYGSALDYIRAHRG